MKAVIYQKPYKVTVEQMPDPTIEAPNDAIVRITTGIYGLDLRMYEGWTPAEPGFIFSHDNQGIVEEVGAEVTLAVAYAGMGPYQGGQAEYLRVPFPRGSKGIGEIGVVGLPAAVANTVYHAAGIRGRDLPITPDKLVG